MLAASMPNADTASALVETATKCFATAFSSPSASTIQVRATLALVSVSSVVNVLDETTTSVLAGSRSRSASDTSVGSMLETNRIVMSRSA